MIALNHKLVSFYYDMITIVLFLIASLLQSMQTTDETIIMNKLADQEKCWNAGDIDCFMEDYWRNDSLVYIGKNGLTYGWESTLENYKKKYPTEEQMGQLSFEIKSLDRMGPDLFFMIGSWHLARVHDELGGHFSLLWKKVNGEWVIIADHSS